MLLRELSKVETQKAKVNQILCKYVILMAELSTVDTFKHAMHLTENIFKSLSEIANAMGKSKFRPFLDEPVLIDNAFRNAKSDNNNKSLAA